MKSTKSLPKTLPIMTHEDPKIEKVVMNILQKCKLEAERNTLQIPLEHVEDRVSFYTGIPVNRLYQLQSIDRAPDSRTNCIDYDTHVKILKCLLQFYERKHFPTFSLLYPEIKKSFKKIHECEWFKQELIRLGIDYQKINNNMKLLMEDPKLTFDRFLYLRKIRQLRQTGALVYYIGERLIDKNLNFKVPWIYNNMEASSISRDEYVFFHAVSRQGYTDGLFSLHPSVQNFYAWVVDILLPLLKPHSVIVLDNNPLHGTLKSKAVSMYDTKLDMLKWLKKHDVPCNYSMNKCQLYEQIKKHTLVDEIFEVDRVLKAHGHEVLRLPRYFETLSPLDFIWKEIKENIVLRNELKRDVLSMFMNTTRNQIVDFENRTEQREQELFKLDADIDNVLDNFLMDLKS